MLFRSTKVAAGTEVVGLGDQLPSDAARERIQSADPAEGAAAEALLRHNLSAEVAVDRVSRAPKLSPSTVAYLKLGLRLECSALTLVSPSS